MCGRNNSLQFKINCVYSKLVAEWTLAGENQQTSQLSHSPMSLCYLSVPLVDGITTFSSVYIPDSLNIFCTDDLPVTVMLDCTSGVIDLAYANWGRSQLYSEVCPEPSGPHQDTYCFHSIADRLSACHGTTSCMAVIPNADGIGTDPCDGTGKYIQILYECTPGKAKNSPSGTICYLISQVKQSFFVLTFILLKYI